MNTLGRALFRAFLAAVTVLAVLVAVYDEQTTAEMLRRKQEESVAAASRQATQFSEEVARTLEKHSFRDLVKQSQGGFLDFEKLSQAMMRQGPYISYVHVKNDKGETLLYKGPKTLQKVVVSGKGVTYTLREGSEVKEIRIERPAGNFENITEVAAPIISGRRVGTVSVGLADDAIAAQAGPDVAILRRRILLYSGIALAVMGTTMLYVRRLLTRLSTLQGRVVQQSRMAYVGTLASGLVHEIRNPLNGINLNLALLEEELESAPDPQRPTFTRLLARIKPGIEHLERLSSEFLLFARPPRLRAAPTDLADHLRQVVEFLRPQCTQKGVNLELAAAAGTGEAEVDRDKIKQILINLVGNSLEATPASGRITVSTWPEPDGESIGIRVADTGRGIPPESRARIFELFYSTKEGGVGLGLAIVKRLVEEHSGTIEVLSLEGQGTTVTIRLPRRVKSVQVTLDGVEAITG